MDAQDEWYRRAQLAVEKGDDELAKEALKRRKSNQENADTMKAQLDQQRKAVDQLISNTKCAALLPFTLCSTCSVLFTRDTAHSCTLPSALHILDDCEPPNLDVKQLSMQLAQQT